MSESVDEKIVAMKLNNSQFEANAKQSLGTLSALEKGLKLDNAAKGLQNVSSAAKNMNLGPLASGVDTVTSKFSALTVMGVTALATITNKAVTAGLALANSLTIAPVKAGFDEYELKMGSIQTMLANTARYGTKLPEISANLEALNRYADKTIYNFGDMTKNISLFTNAGLRIGDATKMIQGFSNVAAASGTSAAGAAGAAYQLSQALSAGKITLMDWRSLTNVGMGNKNMKDGLLDVAVAMGAVEKGSKKAKEIQKDFNGSLKDGWLKSSVMSEYLKIMATDYGAMTKKQLDANKAKLRDLGLTDKQINKLIEQQKMAQKSAQEVRTFSQLLGTVRESIGSGWSETFEIIIGNFTEATKLFTGINEYVSGLVEGMSKARNDMLKGWAKAGGRIALIEGLKAGWQAIATILKAVKDGFREVFPATTGKQLADMTKSFQKFMESLKMGGENADRVKRIFAGIFSIFKVGYTIIKGVATTLLNLFGLAQGGSGGFLELAASVGDFVVKIQEWLTSSGRIQSFFSTINTARAAILVPLFNIISKIAEAFSLLVKGDISGFGDKIGEAFSGLGALIQGVFNSLAAPLRNFLANARDVAGVVGTFLQDLGISAFKPLGDALVKLGDNFGKIRDIISNFGFDLFNTAAAGAKGTMDGLSTTGEKIASVWGNIKKTFSKMGELLGPAADSIGKLFTTITDKIREGIGNMNFDDVLAIVNTGFFIMMYRAISGFVKNLDSMTNTFSGIGTDIKDTLKIIQTTMTDALKTMQQNVKANIILKIAIAIGILALSLKLLSSIDPGALAMGVGAIAALMFVLTKAMGSMMGMLDVVDGEAPKKVTSVLAVGGAMLLLAGAVLILSFAVKNLAGLDWQEMARGLIATGALLAALTLFTKFAETEKQSAKGALSLIVMAGAVYLLSIGVAKLGEMDTAKLVQGGIAVTAILGILVGAAVIMDKWGNKGAPGILAMAGALIVLTPVIIALGLIPFDVLAQGLGVISAALGLLVGAAVIMSKWGNKGAPGIVAMAGALAILAPVIAFLGLLPMKVLAKGLGALAIGLGIMVGATILVAKFGAQAAPGLMAMSVALVVMAGALFLLGQLSWGQLAVALVGLAAGLTIVLVAAAAAIYLSPGLLVLGATFALLGAAMLMAGGGMLMFATGFAVLVAIGTAGFAVLTAGFLGLIQLIPVMAQQIGLGIKAFAVVISEAGPEIIAAITTVLISFLAAIENAAPQFFSTMTTLIMGLVTTIEKLVPRIAAAGAMMILRLLTVIATFVGPIATKATDLMIAFIRAVGKNVPRLVDAGAKAIIDFLNGIAAAIRGNQRQMEDAGKNIASAIVEGMVGGIGRGISAVTTAAKNLAKSALDAAKGFLGIESPSREFAKLGKFSALGYAQGLTGSKAQILAAGKTMQSLIAASMKNATADIKTQEARLKKLKNARNKDRKAIAATTKALAQARAESAKSAKAEKVRRSFTDEMKRLDLLAYREAKLVPQIDAAKKALEEATKARDEYAKSTKDQFDNLPDIDKETKLTDFVTSLEKQVADTQIFTAQLEQLRKMGLSDEMYKLLLAKGTEAIPFATQLLDGGQTSINQVNTLGSSLAKSAEALGDSASLALYQAGVDTAAGLLKGLQSQQAAIDSEMNKIAASMVKAIKKALGIKSPSRMFAEIGKFSAEGLAKGLKDSAATTDKAAEQMGHSTIESLRKSLTGLSEAVMSEIEVDPTIRPVLDLSGIQKDAVKMGEILSRNDLAVGSSFARAKVVASEYSSAQSSRDEMAMAGATPSLVFNQTNNSPKALSNAELYRQSKNGLSRMKGALN